MELNDNQLILKSFYSILLRNFLCIWKTEKDIVNIKTITI